MLLSYYDNAWIVAEFDPDSAQITLGPTKVASVELKTDGKCIIVGGMYVAFYRRDGRLWLLAHDRLFDLDGGAAIDWRLDGSVSVFTASDESGEMSLRYYGGPAYGPPLSEDPTPMLSREHYDFGLFVRNIMADGERREVFRSRPQR